MDWCFQSFADVDLEACRGEEWSLIEDLETSSWANQTYKWQCVCSHIHMDPSIGRELFIWFQCQSACLTSNTSPLSNSTPTCSRAGCGHSKCWKCTDLKDQMDDSLIQIIADSQLGPPPRPQPGPKPRGQATWYCVRLLSQGAFCSFVDYFQHNCMFGPMSMAASPRCPQCGHSRCYHCTLQ